MWALEVAKLLELFSHFLTVGLSFEPWADCYPCFRGWEIDGEVKKLAHELHDCEAKP